jgi:hypothetical protein
VARKRRASADVIAEYAVAITFLQTPPRMRHTAMMHDSGKGASGSRPEEDTAVQYAAATDGRR